ncbi:putative structural protein [Beihai tiger crab virus 1]|uniref:putative structural protein n=1 Tax=Beihai tiger crab virus 1 TaxID=1922711 RepID=UPI0009098E14|nr:putative structural protein [Beihai tiger crab virus 1]APG77634.1 putative structural protein [Beihai tiger crab virus 1]
MSATTSTDGMAAAPSDRAPDTRVAPQTDYSLSTQDVDLTSDSATGYYNIKVVKVIRLAGSTKVGELLAVFFLDGTLEPVLEEMLKAYERWGLDDLQVIVQTGSPFGTSSGSIQMAHIPDPENANFPAEGGQPSLDKIVRQDGSVQIRPRDSCTFKVKTPGTMYTMSSGSRRWSSFGAIVAVCRSVPDSTDFTEWNLTVTGTAKLIRTAVITISESVNYDFLVTAVELDGSCLKLTAASAIPASSGIVHFTRALRITHRNSRDGMLVTRVVKHAKLGVTINDKELVALIGTEGDEPVKIESQLVGTTCTVTIPKLDYLPVFN